jgi:hypothetical protein
MSFVATAVGSTSGHMTNVIRLLPPSGVGPTGITRITVKAFPCSSGPGNTHDL